MLGLTIGLGFRRSVASLKRLAYHQSPLRGCEPFPTTLSRVATTDGSRGFEPTI